MPTKLAKECDLVLELLLAVKIALTYKNEILIYSKHIIYMVSENKIVPITMALLIEPFRNYFKYFSVCRLEMPDC